ncbi:MAG: ABC transporter ATP-binding protein [Planctomycetaceae bacterium]|jgi:lipopolysaccharide transport system ATP-binding protein|nr:ABC transporter ATP-binding protein [Planctomycetaceae bacterium]
MSDFVIRVENLSKEFRLGVIDRGTLYLDIQSWWAKLRGREDPNSIIGTKNLDKKNNNKNRFLALNNVSFNVSRGETVGILGANGAGKSTLFKVISRITYPSRGRVVLCDRVASLLEIGTGFHYEMTGRQNIFLNGAILGMSRSEIMKKFDEIVDFAGVNQFIDTPVKRYSSGMFVRLAFSVAAHLDSEILLIDEVLAVGDAEFQKKCIDKMQQLTRDENRTVLFVSHNIESIRSLCRRAILLEHGNLIMETDNVEEAIKHYTNCTNTQN